MDKSKDRRYRDAKWLAGEYIAKRKSIRQIRKEYGWGFNTIKRWLKRYKLPIRQIGNPVVSKQQGCNRIDIDKLGYSYLHAIMRKKVPNFGVCNSCKKQSDKLDCANISGEYKQEVSDWEWLCRSCHVTSDGRPEKMLAGRSYHGRK